MPILPIVAAKSPHIKDEESLFRFVMEIRQSLLQRQLILSKDLQGSESGTLSVLVY